ncbi:hypothetical protein BGX29_004014 [Mortierella sp. GBA35]|nr:hypothetical protein BGX29_004014 [Mortierella sp. GBA35]
MVAVPPEILIHIGSHFPAESCLACLSVCRQWTEVFTPLLWRSVSNSEQPWHDRLRQSLSSPMDQQKSLQKRIMASIRKHRDSIHHLVVQDDRILRAAVRASIIGLVSLTVGLEGGWVSKDYFHSKSNTSRSLDPSFVERFPPEWAELLPGSIIGPARIPGGWSRTMAFWALVRSNPGGQQALLEEESRSFPVDVLSTLPLLRHLECDRNANDFLPIQLSLGRFPSVTSFVHAGKTRLSPRTFLLSDQASIANTTLRRLVFEQKTNIGLFRAIVVAFPALENCRVNDLGNNMPAATRGQEEILEHSSLKTLSMWVSVYLSLARIRFPKVRCLKGEMDIRQCAELGALLESFPALTSFIHTRRGFRWSYPGSEEVNLEKGAVFAMRALVLEDRLIDPEGICRILSHLPFLVRLDIGEVDAAALTEVARTCRNLEHARLDICEQCSPELSRLFVECSKLRTCLKLERLDICVEGVPRLTEEQE